MDYEVVNGRRRIYRTYNDTEVAVLAVNVECPYCGSQWLEEDKCNCGETYVLECEKCRKEFEMHFDAS